MSETENTPEVDAIAPEEYFSVEWPPDAEGIPHRQAARVVLCNEFDEFLLLRGHDFSDTSHWWWFTIGGGLEPGEEPTEHVLAELSEQAQELARADLALMLIARDEASLRQQTVRETLVTLPFARSYIEPEGTAASAVARRLYVEPDKLPLLFLTDPEGTAVYGSSGYNVGSVAMAIAAAARGKPENM